MDLLKFSGSEIHGYMNIEVEFNDQLTFLTGINGSGKTTALNCIVSLLFPKVQFLCDLTFKSMRLDILDDGRKKFIWCERTETGIALGCSGTEDVLTLNSYLHDPSSPVYKKPELETEYYGDLISSVRGHAFMAFLSTLPSPMYLGLDRRILLGERNRSARPKRGYLRRSVQKTSAFSNSLETSFFEAIELVEESQLKARMEESVLDREFQRKLLLDLIQIEPFSFGTEIAIPTKSELGRLDEAKRRLKKLSSLMGVNHGEVDQALSPILSYLSNVAEALSSHASNKRKGVSLDFNDPITRHIIDWSSNQQNLKKILRIAHHIDEHNVKLKLINDTNDRYMHAINKFLHSSSKLIDIDDRGNVVFATRAGDAVRGIESLSSGEVQVFVIITHLFFNPNARIGNVFIIDEPELSLHIQWQEMFVDSILEASEGVQFILATHSPSVILDRVSSCVEVSS